MTKFYQHSDEVIEAARILRQELMNDSPYGNEEEARQWFLKRFMAVESLANQTTEAEAERAGEHIPA